MKENNHGGYRPNAGRPTTNRSCAVSIRISPEAKAKLARLTDKPSEYIDNLILSINE